MMRAVGDQSLAQAARARAQVSKHGPEEGDALSRASLMPSWKGRDRGHRGLEKKRNVIGPPGRAAMSRQMRSWTSREAVPRSRRSSTTSERQRPATHDSSDARGLASSSCLGLRAHTHRNPTWLVEVSTGCAWRAAGR